MKDYNTLPDAALLRLAEVVSPDGPVHLRRSAWLDRVRRGLAPAPVVREPRLTAWRWRDIRGWLESQGDDR